MDYRLKRHDGEYCWFQVLGKPLQDQQGQFTGYIGITMEISNRKQFEEQLITLNRQLEATNQELKLFTTVASHDLQEPMRKVSAFTERLREACEADLSPEALNYLGRIEKSSHRMQNLIQALLRYSRLSVSPQPTKPVALDTVLFDVLSELELLISETQAVITISAPLPIIRGNAIQIFQLFLNLVGNALKYRHPQQVPQILIAPVAQPPEGLTEQDGFCIIMVSDNGIGFDTKYAERIFQPFQRIHDINCYEGTGMGLAICQKIIDLHQGGVVVKSIVNQGSQFYIQLPLAIP